MDYNSRVKTFPNGQQITIYSKTFSRETEEKKKNEKLSKSYFQKKISRETKSKQKSYQNQSVKHPIT